MESERLASTNLFEKEPMIGYCLEILSYLMDQFAGNLDFDFNSLHGLCKSLLEVIAREKVAGATLAKAFAKAAGIRGFCSYYFPHKV